MKVELWDIDDVIPYQKNPRLNDDAVEAVAKSIQAFGFRQPVVVDSEGIIIVGHTRWKAARKLGLQKIPVHVATDLTPDQVKAYRLADNQTNTLSEWDYALLPAELQDLRASNFDLSLLGFDPSELAELLDPDGAAGKADPDNIPAPPDAATSKNGDIYLLGEHRLMCGDSGNPDDLDKLLAGAKIHLVNTDPPYNVKVASRSNNAIAASGDRPMGRQGMDMAIRKGEHKVDQKLRAKDRPLANDFVSDEQFASLLREWFGNITRVLEPGRSFYIWGGYINIANYPPALAKSELYFSQMIIWVKEHPVLTRKDFMGNHEWCFYGWKEGAGHSFYGDHNIRDVWHVKRAVKGNVAVNEGIRLVRKSNGASIDILPADPMRKMREIEVPDTFTLHGRIHASDVWSVKKVNPQNMVHLTEKPVELAVRALQFSSKAGENILDLFGGSGSTLIAAEMTKRHAYLMEMDTLYCDVIRKRWAEFVHGKGCDWRKATPRAKA